ncbi:MAG: S8 family peptidase [Lachnospiraceae bacterium]|nr:S8 family peptidase [Lachnospiraceae bacterium]
MTCREQILSNDYADALVDFRLEPDNPFQNRMSDFCYQNIENDFGILYIKRTLLGGFDESDYDYLYIPKCYGLQNAFQVHRRNIQVQDKADNEEIQVTQLGRNFDPLPLISAGILPLQSAPLELTGKGVVIGFIDTGIRYENEVFRRPDGTSRILAIWDQTIQTGEPPEGLQYGTEYTREQINAALISENPRDIVPSTDVDGHGTAIASVAAGSILGEGQQFIGAAPDADIVVVKLKTAKPYLKEYYMIPEAVPAYASSDIWSGIKYLDSFARTFSRPVVICLGMGSNQGDHSGTSTSSRYMNLIANKRSRCFVVCGGNEGNEAHHYEANIILPAQTNWRDVEIRMGENERGVMTELWGSPPFDYTVSIKSPSGETIPRIFYRGNRMQSYSFIYDRTRITVGYSVIEQNSGETLIVMRFQDPTPGIWTVRVFAEGNSGEANFHMWLPIKEFSSSDTYFLSPSPYVTLTVPGMTQGVFTPSTYDSKTNGFYTESGRGYTRTGRIKPDISAPGVNISTILGTRTGSSYAAALTAGAAAQFLQWAVVEEHDTRVNTNDIKNYFIYGARRDDDFSYPNREFGYGRLNLAGTFQWLAGLR